MKTRITELLGIRYPIVLSGMSWVSVPSLVAAVSEAGGLGILATGVFNAEQTRAAIRAVRALTDKPFGANVTLYFPGARENAQVLLEERVPVINFSMGKGDWIVKAAHEYGGKVIATVTTVKHAQAAAAYGTDAVIVTGHEAAAHGGDVTSLVLVPRIADAVALPIVAAGGFADGRGLAAALALGADGIAMGTRFMSTAESPVHERAKRFAVETDSDDTVYSDPLRRPAVPGHALGRRRPGDPPRARPQTRGLRLARDRRDDAGTASQAGARRARLGVEEHEAARPPRHRVPGVPPRHRGRRRSSAACCRSARSPAWSTTCRPSPR